MNDSDPDTLVQCPYGIDIGEGSIAAAKEIEPCIDWVLGSAEAVEFDDEACDCVISQFGMKFFRDRTKSAEEVFRVLRPGGSLAIAIWNSLEQSPACGDIIAVLQEQVGTVAADALRLSCNRSKKPG